MSAPITNIPSATRCIVIIIFTDATENAPWISRGALFGLICLFPVLAILAILLAIVQRTSPFFLQKRIGHGLKPFHIIKFKTMKDTRDKEGNLLPDEERTTVLGSCCAAPPWTNCLNSSTFCWGHELYRPTPLDSRSNGHFTPSTRKKECPCARASRGWPRFAGATTSPSVSGYVMT